MIKQSYILRAYAVHDFWLAEKLAAAKACRRRLNAHQSNALAAIYLHPEMPTTEAEKPLEEICELVSEAAGYEAAVYAVAEVIAHKLVRDEDVTENGLTHTAISGLKAKRQALDEDLSPLLRSIRGSLEELNEAVNKLHDVASLLHS